MKPDILKLGVRAMSNCISGQYDSEMSPSKPVLVLYILAQSCPTLRDSMDCNLPVSSVYGDSPGKNTGVGYHALLQGIFPTQGSNPCVIHCRLILYHLRNQGRPRMLEWVAYPFSRGSSWSRNGIRFACIAFGSLPAGLPGNPNKLAYQWLTYRKNVPSEIF